MTHSLFCYAHIEVLVTFSPPFRLGLLDFFFLLVLLLLLLLLVLRPRHHEHHYHHPHHHPYDDIIIILIIILIILTTTRTTTHTLATTGAASLPQMRIFFALKIRVSIFLVFIYTSEQICGKTNVFCPPLFCFLVFIFPLELSSLHFPLKSHPLQFYS